MSCLCQLSFWCLHFISTPQWRLPAKCIWVILLLFSSLHLKTQSALDFFPLVQRLIWAMLLLAPDCDFGFVLGYSLLPVPVYIGFAYWFIKRKWILCSEMVSYYFLWKLLTGCMGKKNFRLPHFYPQSACIKSECMVENSPIRISFWRYNWDICEAGDQKFHEIKVWRRMEKRLRMLKGTVCNFLDFFFTRNILQNFS